MRGPCTAMKSGRHLLQLDKPCLQQPRPNAAKKNLFSSQLDVITLRKPLINNYFLYMPVTGLNRQSNKFFFIFIFCPHHEA